MGPCFAHADVLRLHPAVVGRMLCLCACMPSSCADTSKAQEYAAGRRHRLNGADGRRACGLAHISSAALLLRVPMMVLCRHQ
jgi:hypothetical protein